MYSREIQPPSGCPVQNGKPLQGTWTRPFERVNLRDTENPFSIPLPKWLTNFRIKEWQSFIIQNDELFFESLTANLKFFRFIEAAFFDKKNNEMKHYFDCFPFAFWELPESLDNSFVECKALGYSMSIHNCLNTSAINFSFEVNSIEDLPGLETEFELSFGPKKRLPLVTNLLFSEERSVYSYKNLGTVSGQLSVGEESCFILDPESTLGIFRDCKGFFPYLTRSEWINGLGFTKDGRTIGFSMAENQAKAENKDNENVLWIQNSLTALPPVRITHSTGIDQNWIIEDVEGMVDLCFTPQKQVDKKGYDILLSKAAFYNPVGFFNGTIMTKDGEKIHVHNLWGCAESLYLRL